MILEWPLLGRSAELRTIIDTVRGDGRRSRGIVLSGTTGVGKTYLAREAITALSRPPVTCRWIAGTASARSVPLGAFADIASDFGPDPLHRVREVISTLIGDGEVILGVDDAHLLDDLSAFAVHQLVSRGLATVILTIRSGEPAPDAITAIWTDGLLTLLELQPLPADVLAELVEHALDGPVHSRCAQQLWQYTQGNVLYLRHLIDSEVRAGRITRQSGVWLWDGRPQLSASLTELVEAGIARSPQNVRTVLDALVVAEPLSADVLARVTEPGALAEAESLGLVHIDGGSVRLAHPMFGEVRRTGSLRMRRLRGAIATELAGKNSADPRDLVRRAVLAIDSDLPPDPALLSAATWAAIRLLALQIADTLAQHAVAAGSGIEAQLARVMALTWQERGEDAERVLAELASDPNSPLRVQISMLRALNFASVLGRPGAAERVLDDVGSTDENTAPLACAVRALIAAVRGHAEDAVERAHAVVNGTPDHHLAYMLSTFALISGLTGLGRIAEVEAAAEAGYALAQAHPEVSHLRVPLSFLHAYAGRPAGALAQLDATITRIRSDTLDIPFEGSWQVAESWRAFVGGLSAICRGELANAQRACRESLVDAGADHGGRMRKRFARLWLADALAMAGLASDAHREFAPIQRWDADPEARGWHVERSLTHAWVCAAEGAVSEAVEILSTAAAQEAELGRPAWEVLLLQTATQFGDRTTAVRLTELAGVVEGPRAPVAAAHAVALAADDGDGLLAAAARYQQFGDLVAAADAAAQGNDAYRRAGKRGSALTASATAQRLAAACGADTPALRADTLRLPVTARQREIIALAAQGFTNKQIADRLGMSRRSVEGHLFRACQRVGVNSRDQLIALLHNDSGSLVSG
ncbi:LuxR C-terminal-related transcriptional regulator [Mycobacterium sp. BMJ-28]